MTFMKAISPKKTADVEIVAAYLAMLITHGRIDPARKSPQCPDLTHKVQGQRRKASSRRLKTPGAFLNNATYWPGYGRTSGMRGVLKTPGAFLNNATRWPGYGRTSGMRCVLKTPGAFLNNATRWPGYGRTSGMRCVIAQAGHSWMTVL